MRWWRAPVPPRPHRSCKDQLHPCALPVMVSRVSAALTSPVFQTDAFTGLASWTASGAIRYFAIWRGPAESNRYQCAGSAWHSQYTRSASFDGSCRRMVGNRGIEPRVRKGAGFTGPLSHQTWRYPKCLETSRRAEGFCWRAGTAIYDHQPWQPREASNLCRRPSTGYTPCGYYRRPKPAAYFSSSTSQYRKSRHVSCKKLGGKCRCAAIS
jgi:hypothetical protein